MNKKRLLLVAKALRESPNPDRFLMRRFGWDCGTPACAMGHYAHRRDLQKVFRLNNTGYVVRTANGKEIHGVTDHWLMRHFGITGIQAQQLFNGSTGCDCAATPTQAAKFIEHFVEAAK